MKYIKYIVTTLLIMGGIIGTAHIAIEQFYSQSTSEKQVQKTSDNPTEVNAREIELSEAEPISILLTGLDSGALMYEDVETSRTDVLMVLTMNPSLETTTITSIPRDTWTVVNEESRFDKINHAYTYGGIQQTKKAVEHYLNIPIDYYVSVNMKAFIETINAMDGLEITPNQTFSQDGTSFTEGERQTFNGEETIAYVRMRKEDEEGDIGRQKRQRQVVDEIITQYLSLENATKVPELYSLYNEHVETNFNIGDFVQLYRKYQPSLTHITNVAFEEYTDIQKHGIYYLYITDMHRNTIHKALATNLEIKESFRPIIYPLEQVPNQPYVNIYNDHSITPGSYSKEDLTHLLKEGV